MTKKLNCTWCEKPLKKGEGVIVVVRKTGKRYAYCDDHAGLCMRGTR